LGDLFRGVSGRDFLATAVAVGKLANVLAALGSSLVNSGSGVDGFRAETRDQFYLLPI